MGNKPSSQGLSAGIASQPPAPSRGFLRKSPQLPAAQPVVQPAANIPILNTVKPVYNIEKFKNYGTNSTHNHTTGLHNMNSRYHTKTPTFNLNSPVYKSRKGNYKFTAKNPKTGVNVEIPIDTKLDGPYYLINNKDKKYLIDSKLFDNASSNLETEIGKQDTLAKSLKQEKVNALLKTYGNNPDEIRALLETHKININNISSARRFLKRYYNSESPKEKASRNALNAAKASENASKQKEEQYSNGPWRGHGGKKRNNKTRKNRNN